MRVINGIVNKVYSFHIYIYIYIYIFWSVTPPGPLICLINDFSKSCLKVAQKESKFAFCDESCSKVKKKNFLLPSSKNMQIVKQNKEFLSIFVQF